MEQACRALRPLAAELHAERFQQELDLIAEKLLGHRFNAAFFGQFKRGKSTIINALTSSQALPTGVIPVTSVVTVLRQGPTDTARVSFIDGQSVDVPLEELSEYVTEAKNPNNAKRVDIVDVQLSSQVLAGGLCLVDTPGLGSVYRHSSRATQEYMANIDVAVLVTGLDPPLTDDELSMFMEAASQASAAMVIINKVDKVGADEGQQALSFVKRNVSEALRRSDVPFFAVSAREVLEGSRPTRDWAKLSNWLREMAASDADAIVTQAGRRGVLRCAQGLQQLIDQRRYALIESSETVQRRIDALRAVADRADQRRGELRYGLKAKAEAIETELRAHHRKFLTDSLPRAIGTFRAKASGGEVRSRKDVWERARSIAGALLEQWRQWMQPHAGAAYKEAIGRFVETANGYLNGVAADTGLKREELPAPLSYDVDLQARSHLFYTDLLSLTSSAPWRWFFDLFLPREMVVRSSMRAGERYINAVLETNSARIVNDLRDRMGVTRQEIEEELQATLRQAVGTAEQAARDAAEVAGRGQAAVEAELERLRAGERSLEAVKKYRTPIPVRAGFSR